MASASASALVVYGEHHTCSCRKFASGGTRACTAGSQVATGKPAARCCLLLYTYDCSAQLPGNAGEQCASCSVRQTDNRQVGRQLSSAKPTTLHPLPCAGPIGAPELLPVEGPVSASATFTAPIRFRRTLGCMSCWVRVGRALYTGAFLHSYVQCPVCRHRWHTTPALPPPRLGACSRIRVERRCSAVQDLKTKQLPQLTLVACRAVAGCCAAKAATACRQGRTEYARSWKGLTGAA